MKKITPLQLILLILAVAILGTPHFVTVSAQRSTVAVSGVMNGFQLSISIDKTQYSSGEDVNITCAITNVSNQTLNFINQNGNLSFNFQVYNSTNYEVYSWLLGAYPLVNATVSLAPNENYTQTLIWTQEADNSRGFPQAPTGAYSIIGDLGERLPYQLQTTPLNITITMPNNTTVPESATPTSSSTPNSTATVPELSWLVIVPLLLSVFSVALVVRHRKTANLRYRGTAL